MTYFGGGGVRGRLHSSLQVYIDCLSSPPFPRMWPRGGGVWDQDPILVRDFRVIRDYEVKWKDGQRELAGSGGSPTGGVGGLENALDEYIKGIEDGEAM